jgi:hypothetical protein
MINAARRRILLGSVSVVALVAGASVALTYGEEAWEYVSFKDAHWFIADKVNKEIALSEKDFGIKYTPEQVKLINDRLWDKTQYELLKYYRPKEGF